MHTNNKRVILPIQPYFVITSQLYRKCPQYSSNIIHFYQFDLHESFSQAVPDGTFDIIFQLDETAPEAFIAGPSTQIRRTVLKKNVEYFGVRLAYGVVPFSVYPFISAKEMVDAETDLAAIYPNNNDFLDAFFEEAFADTKFKARIAAFEKHIAPKIFFREEQHESTVEQHMMKVISNCYGIISISQLAKKLGYSERDLRQLFSQMYGISPKKFADIIKFQHTVHLLKQNDDFTKITYASGYYDQPHFMHVFRQYTQCTPKQFAAMLTDKNYRRKMVIV